MLRMLFNVTISSSNHPCHTKLSNAELRCTT
jgi:hypothetical protein